MAFKKPKDAQLTLTQQRFNKAHNGLRAICEHANALLKMTFKAQRNVSIDPRRIGAIAAAALVLIHFGHSPHHMTFSGHTVTRNAHYASRPVIVTATAVSHHAA